MKKVQIHHVSVMQTSYVLTMCYMIIFFFMAIGVALWGLMQPDGFTPLMAVGVIILLPLIYGAATWVIFVITCFLYNFVAKRFGAIEITVNEE